MEKFELTLYDYRNDLNWVRQMGWSDEELQQVPVHEQATAGENYLNLANFGGTTLGVTARGGPTSAAVHNIHNLYVYERETPEHLYKQLREMVDRGGPSAYEEDGVFGERGEDSSFPPEG
ncbi:MAG: hypothetical protein EPO21_22580 [Chloroflexota bacterium]|nr:MAG: hypothetical protein EPO21_22580 [Chloroflexota bacterium]